MSRDLKEKVFPLSYEKHDWDTCRQEWEGEYYSTNPAHCICGVKIVDQYVIRNKLTRAELIVGNVCIKQFDKLLIEWAESEKKMHSSYSVTGKFQKRGFGKNSFKVRKNTKLTKMLSNLEEKGYKVPMYGYKYLYISVTENLTREAMKDYKLNLKLVEYDKPNKGVVLKSLPEKSKKRKLEEVI